MKKNINLMYAISFLQGMVFYPSISTLYRQAYGVTVAQMMLLEAVSFLVTLVLEVPWGILADDWQRSTPLSWSAGWRG